MRRNERINERWANRGHRSFWKGIRSKCWPRKDDGPAFSSAKRDPVLLLLLLRSMRGWWCNSSPSSISRENSCPSFPLYACSSFPILLLTNSSSHDLGECALRVDPSSHIASTAVILWPRKARMSRAWPQTSVYFVKNH